MTTLKNNDYFLAIMRSIFLLGINVYFTFSYYQLPNDIKHTYDAFLFFTIIILIWVDFMTILIYTRVYNYSIVIYRMSQIYMIFGYPIFIKYIQIPKQSQTIFVNNYDAYLSMVIINALLILNNSLLLKYYFWECFIPFITEVYSNKPKIYL